MENKDQNHSFSYSNDGSKQPVSSGVMHKPPPENALSLEGETGTQQTLISQERLVESRSRRFWRFIRRPYWVIAVLLFLTSGAALINGVRNRSDNNIASTIPTANRFSTVKIPLSDLVSGKNLAISGGSNVTINGALQVSDYLQLGASLQPTGAKAGQIYYDQGLNQLAYYNGSNFVFLTGPAAGGVQSLGGSIGQLTLGGGLSLVNNELSNGGVLSVQGQNGAVTFTAGAGILISGTQFSNSGVISIASSSPNLSVANDGKGNVTLSVTGGTGTITSAGGTAGRIPLFTAAQNVEDSIISQAGLAITVGGDLTVTGNLNLSSALTVGQGGTGATTLTANGVLVGNGAAAISSVAAGGAGLCLLSTVGAPAWGVCPGGGGVTSLNSLTGALSIANASGAGATITIDDASTSAKGIASFNGINFSVASGAVNTIQNINTGASPTFAGVNTNAITPSAALTVGATGQSLLLQGNASTTLTANNGGSATTVSFQSPTANVTYRFLTASAGSYDICTTVGNCSGVGGGVTTPGGNANRVAKFMAGQTIADSSITDDGTNVLTSIDMVIQGGDLTVGVPTTQTGTINLAHSGSAFLGSILQGALSANRTYTLPDASGTICLSSGNCAGGVTSLNGLVGALSIANASAAGSTITINDATTGAKGIASFNGTNFSVSSGAVNTIQDIHTTATPTFTGVNTNTITPSGALTVGATSQTALLSGSITTITSTGVGNDIILTSADTIELQSATNVTGNIDISGTLTSGTANAFQVAAGGDITTAGNATAQGGTVTAGTSSQAGSFVINDGSSNTGALQVAPLGQNTTYTLPDPGGASATICLASGNCSGVGGGVTTAGGSTNRLAKFSGAQSIADSTITDNGTTVTTTVDLVIQGGDVTVGTSSQLASLLLHDGNGQTTTIQAGDSSGSLTFILPTNTGSANQCLKQSGTGNQLVWDACDGGGGGSSGTLQTAYNNGNSISTTDNRDIDIVLADSVTTDSNFDLVVADGSTGFASFSRANGSGTADPAQLLLINNLDADRALPTGVKLQAAGGGMTTAIDATDAEIVDAINVAANNIVGTTGNIDFTSFDVAGASGDITSAGNATLQGGVITVGTSSQAGSLVLSDGSSNTGILQVTALGANRTYTLPDESGAVCLSTGNCASAGVTLQGAYDNSTSPEIVVDATRGALTVRDNSGGIGTNLLEVQNNAGSTTYLGITTSGISVTGTTTSSGNINASGGVLQTSSTTRVDSSGNLTNIGNLTATGAVTIASSGAGNDIVINGADIFDVQDATTFAGTAGFNDIATFNSDLVANGNATIGSSASDLLTIGAVLQGGSPLVFEGASADANELTLSIATLAGDRTITLPDESGTVCLQGSINCSFAPATGSANYINNTAAVQAGANIAIQSAADANVTLFLKERATQSADIIRVVNSGDVLMFNFDAFGNFHQVGSAEFESYVGIGIPGASSAGVSLGVYTDQDANVGLRINGNNGQTGDLAQLFTGSTEAFSIAGQGAAHFQNATNSTAAFRVQNASSQSLLNVDTTNNLLTVSSFALFQPASDSATAFQVRTSGGTSILTIDSSTNNVTMGSGTTLTIANTSPGSIVGPAWTSYTVTWTSAGTAPAIGNGTLSGRYYKIGRIVEFNIRMTSGATTTYGSSNAWTFSLPVMATSAGTQVPVMARVFDATTPGTFYICMGLINGAVTTISQIVCNSSNGTPVANIMNNNNPFAWATAGSNIIIEGSYESAN